MLGHEYLSGGVQGEKEIGKVKPSFFALFSTPLAKGIKTAIDEASGRP